MRRKILCVLLVIMTALAVAACGGDNSQDSSQNAFEAFTEVQKNMEDVRDAEFKMAMDMTTDAAGEDDEVTMKMSGTGKEILKSLGIEGDYEGIGHLVLGYAAAPLKEAAPRKADYVYYIR